MQMRVGNIKTGRQRFDEAMPEQGLRWCGEELARHLLMERGDNRRRKDCKAYGFLTFKLLTDATAP